jgi:PAS domain S-box-containing protein
MARKRPRAALLAQIKALSLRLEEAEDTLRAIGKGEVDAFVVSGPGGKQVFTLKGAEQPYRVLVETMNEGAATLGADGTILYCNSRLAALLQIPLETLIGRKFAALVAPPDLPICAARLAACSCEGAADEIVLLSEAGQQVPVLISWCANEISGKRVLSLVVTDLTQQKRNDEIVASERLARSIIEQAGEAIVVCDEAGIIIRASSLTPQLCGQNPLLKHFNEMFQLSVKGSGGLFSVLSPLNGMGIKNQEVEFRRSDGLILHFLLNAAPLRNAQNGIAGCVVTLADITERKLGEVEMFRLNEALESRVTERTEELAATIEKLKGEIVERESMEESLLRLNRLYLVLSQTNHAIICTMDRDALFRGICRIAVEDGGFRLAWVGLLDESGAVHVAAASGATGYLEDFRTTALRNPMQLWPTGVSLRADTHCICNDFQDSLVAGPWQLAGADHGIASAASIPLKQQGRVIGALTLYADEKYFFDQQQTVLLQQMGADFSFALDNISRETLRQAAERSLHEETAERLRTLETLREKEKMLIQQSRQAAMGEMIANIAHQWRQPLNTLALSIQELKMMHGLGECDDDYMRQSVDKSMGLIQHMSHTIDDFRDYFKPDKEKMNFKVSEVIQNTRLLVEDSFKHQKVGIQIVTQQSPVIFGYRNEFAQSLLNILNNARDALTEKYQESPMVTITISSVAGRALITVADNAGGIPEEIIDKIFDPYFTTKAAQQGTGLGLFMSKTIIEKNLGGKLTVRNTGAGAEFRIEV